MAWRRGLGGKGKVEGDGYARECEGKVAYPSESSARATLDYYLREGAIRSGDGMDVYECRHCRNWHFGH